MIRISLIPLLWFLVASSATAASFDQYSGEKVRTIKIVGLKRTSETAVRWLIGTSEGEVFDAEAWDRGINKLFNTIALYDIRTEITEVPDALHEIDIELSLKDKWTFLPFGTFQGSGNLVQVGGGVFDTNFGGYFTNMSAGVAQLGTQFTYDFNLFQEWVGRTDYQVWLDISRNGFPIDLFTPDGTDLGGFSWIRNQQELMVGRRFPNVRLQVYFDLFRDQISSGETTAGAEVYDGQQYRLRPTVIIGRDNYSNYLEQGYELTFAPSFSNFLSSGKSFGAVQATFKHTFVVNGEDNVAYFVNVGAMSSSLLPYQFHLGGYDTIRGFSTTRFLGPYYLAANLEYRMLLGTKRLSWFGLDLLAIQTAFFSDAGWIWADSGSRLGAASLGLLSAGLGLRFNFVKFAGCILRLDVARTITPNDGFGISFGVGQFF